MKKMQCAIDLYNGITRHRLNFYDYANNTKDNVMTVDDIKYALMSLVFLDVLYNKETMIETDKEANYSSKMSDNFLEDMFAIMNITDENQNISKLEDGATFLAIIRNKIAHGDYYIDGDDLVFLKENDEIRINFFKFISFYAPLVNVLDARIIDKSYTKTYLLNKGNLVVKEPITTNRQLESFLSLLKLKSYNLRRLDDKPLATREKLRLKEDITLLEQKAILKEDIKQLDRELVEKYEKEGYILTITNKKVKDPKLIKEIKNIIDIDNSLFDSDKYSINDLVFMYGNDISKLLDNEYEDTGIRYGIRINMILLNQMRKNNVLDINLCDSKLLGIIDSFRDEVVAVMSLARIYGLYCHPFDNIYKQENRYHFCRDDELDFSKLNLSDIKPDIINIENNGIKEVENKIANLVKKINSLNTRLNELNKNILGMKNNNNLTDKQIDKLKLFIIEEENKTKQLNELYDIYFEYQMYLEAVKKDYEENKDYFYNRAIIEGIRNSIAHGDVTIENCHGTKYVGDTILKFTNKHNNQVLFQASVNLYNLEGLFEIQNTSILSDFFDEKMSKKTKVKK